MPKNATERAEQRAALKQENDAALLKEAKEAHRFLDQANIAREDARGGLTVTQRIELALNPRGPEQMFTSHDVGKMLQMDPSSVVKWVNDGLLPAFKTPGGHRRIKATDLAKFLQAHQMYIPPALAQVVKDA